MTTTDASTTGFHPGSEAGFETDQPPSSPERARAEYHRELTGDIYRALMLAAARGWTPDDIRHLLSSKVDHLLFRAAHLVSGTDQPPGAETITEPTLQAWARQCHPVKDVTLSTAALEDIRDRLRQVRPLHDAVLLADAHAVDEQDRAFAALSPEQRKAHHRITALLKKAEATNFEGEADVLVAKAQQLRQRYRIEAVLLARETVTETIDTEFIAQRVYLRSPWIRHQFSLLSGVARTNSCATMLLTRDGIATVVGQLDDVRHVTDLFASLNRQRDQFMRTSPGAHDAASSGETSAYRRSFMVSYTAHITVLLNDATRHAAAEDLAHHRTLPVLAARGTRAQQMLSELFPRSRSITFTSRHTGGYRDGIYAARQTRLGGDAAGLDPMSA